MIIILLSFCVQANLPEHSGEQYSQASATNQTASVTNQTALADFAAAPSCGTQPALNNSKPDAQAHLWGWDSNQNQ